MVDERDFQLLANLLKEPLASNEELGRRVRLSGTAVKTRLEGLAEEGVFGGLYGIPAPEVFQRQRHVYVFRGERVNATAPHKAIQIDPVVSVHLRQDGNLPAILYEPPNESAEPRRPDSGWSVHDRGARSGGTGARPPVVQPLADLAPSARAGPPRHPDEAAPVRRRERDAGAPRHLPLLSG